MHRTVASLAYRTVPYHRVPYRTVLSRTAPLRTVPYYPNQPPEHSFNGQTTEVLVFFLMKLLRALITQSHKDALWILLILLLLLMGGPVCPERSCS